MELVQTIFNGDYMEALKEFVRIPSLNPIFDPEWKTNKALEKQCEHLVRFVESQGLQGLEIKVLHDLFHRSAVQIHVCAGLENTD